MNPGYQALRESAALVDLPGRGHIRVTGEDRGRLLHAMCTAHIEELTPDRFAYAFFLNAQGRILADAYVLCRPDHFLLDTEPEIAAPLVQHLDHYIIADDASLEDATAATAVLGVEGPAAPACLERLGLPALAAGQMIEGHGALFASITASGAAGFRIYASAAAKAHILDLFAPCNLARATPDDLHRVRIENARPRYGEDITSHQIPHETQCLHAVHFSKGCYLGQEIVERVRSRGHVNRLLVHLTLDTSAPPAPGSKLMLEGKEVGQITSSVVSPALGRSVAFAYARAEAIAAGTPAFAGDVAVEFTGKAPR